MEYGNGFFHKKSSRPPLDPIFADGNEDSSVRDPRPFRPSDPAVVFPLRSRVHLDEAWRKPQPFALMASRARAHVSTPCGASAIDPLRGGALDEELMPAAGTRVAGRRPETSVRRRRAPGRHAPPTRRACANDGGEEDARGARCQAGVDHQIYGCARFVAVSRRRRSMPTPSPLQLDDRAPHAFCAAPRHSRLEADAHLILLTYRRTRRGH